MIAPNSGIWGMPKKPPATVLRFPPPKPPDPEPEPVGPLVIRVTVETLKPQK